MDSTPVNKDITQKLMELSSEGCFFTHDLLVKHGLNYEEAIDVLYHDDCLDLITYDEALSVSSCRGTIKKRRDKIYELRPKILKKIMRGKYAPHELLDHPEAYNLLLKYRNDYMPIKDAMKLLKINRKTMSRYMKKENIAFKYNKFITSSDYIIIRNLVEDDISAIAAAKELGVHRATFYRRCKAINIEILNHRITRNDLDRYKSTRWLYRRARNIGDDNRTCATN